MMSGYPEDEYIQLSAVQHVMFCERQCYLIHVEQIWLENYSTAAGELAHQRVDSQETTYSPEGLKQVRSLLLCSRKYGLSGRADLIEFDVRTGAVFPVEYKIGGPKKDLCDVVQLCAQAFCLEEMLNLQVGQGAVYYGRTHQRMLFELTDEIRAETERQIERAHHLFRLEQPPLPSNSEKCRNCSLKEYCLPQLKYLTSPEIYIRNTVQKELSE